MSGLKKINAQGAGNRQTFTGYVEQANQKRPLK